MKDRVGFDKTVEFFSNGIGRVRWRPAFGFEGLSWYYAEEELYVIKDSRFPTDRYAFISAKSAEAACSAAAATFHDYPF